MNEIQEKVIHMNGYKLHLLQNKKFKTIHVVAKFKSPLNRRTITKRALLPYVLRQGSLTFPTRKMLEEKLDFLYGAMLSIDSAKKGNEHVMSFRLEVANQKFIKNETNVLEEAIGLFNDVIFNPLVENDTFNQEIFNREKETLRKKINSIIDNKMNYANMRLIDEMCSGELYQLHLHGYEEDLQKITPENIYAYYKNMIETDDLDIYLLGDFNEEELVNIFSSTISRQKSGRVKMEKSIEEEINRKKDVKEVIEKQQIQQAKLHIGYRTNCTFKDRNYPALQLFNGLLGAFPSSKLFLNVREKNSLAYYASSRIESHKGLLFIVSGIHPKDYEQAKEIIKQQMVAMKNGNFTIDDLEKTKDLIIHHLLETLDHPQGIIEYFYQQVVANITCSPKSFMEKIKRVTKQEVIDVAQKITEDTIYLLTSEGVK